MSDPRTTPPTKAKWTDAFPTPRASPCDITNEELAQLIRTKEAGKDFIVIDVRRTDFEFYAIPTAINLPAHSFYPTLPGLLPLLSKISLVIFHCQSCGSPGSRGNRTAGWYQDALDDKDIKTSEARYLEGGIKGWIERFGQGSGGELVIKLPDLGSA